MTLPPGQDDIRFVALTAVVAHAVISIDENNKILSWNWAANPSAASLP